MATQATLPPRPVRQQGGSCCAPAVAYAADGDEEGMRELTGYPDKHSRPIREGDILQNNWGDLLTVRWSHVDYEPFCYDMKHWQTSVVQVVESRYSAVGEAILIVDLAQLRRRTAED